jgi:Domain of unknown function (DUF4388)
MSKGRDTAAESLTSVLELARLRRQSGLLSVEHTQGGRLEEGEIYFQNGQPIYARVGQISGKEALAWLLQWRQIHFTFLIDVPRPPTNIPVQFSRDTGSNVSVPMAMAPSSLASHPQLSGSVSTNALTERDRSYPSSSSRPNPYPSSIESLIPQKLENERDVLSLPLTRPQRCIYFLVNGQRTVADLSRTIGKSIQEVERILSELQEQGLISV